MKSTNIIGTKSPTWVRALQIGIGVVAIGLSLSGIIFPVLTVVATFTVAAIILLLLGIEHVIAGIFLYQRSRFAHIGLGILVIILSSIVMAYPLASAAFAVLLAAIALLFSGISSIIAGLRGGNSDEKNGRNTNGKHGFKGIEHRSRSISHCLVYYDNGISTIWHRTCSFSNRNSPFGVWHKASCHRNVWERRNCNLYIVMMKNIVAV